MDASKLKSGDQVVCILDCDPGRQFTSGKTYTVDFVMNQNIKVLRDDKGTRNGWHQDYFEPLVTVAPKFFYCARNGDGEDSGLVGTYPSMAEAQKAADEDTHATDHVEIYQMVSHSTVKRAWA